MRQPSTIAAWIAAALLGCCAAAHADAPSALAVAPAEVRLDGPRAKQQLLVTGMYPDEQASDLTGDAQTVRYESLDPNVAAITSTGLVTPLADGSTEIVVRHLAFEARVAVTVAGISAAAPLDFRYEVVPALARGGCSQGACHGSPQGKNGFRLSLRGFNPELDLLSLAREAYGRRTNPAEPGQSLMLLKASGRVPHQGGLRFRQDDPAYRVLHDWVAEGCRDTGSHHELDKLEVLPGRRRLHTASPRQQIVARAHFRDGSVSDVTHLAVMTSSNEQAAQVDGAGVVRFDRTAEATILVRYLDRVLGVPLTYVRRDPDFVFSAPPEANDIDRHVQAKQRLLQLHAAPLAADEVFLRRVYLDTIGVPPTPEEAVAFLDSPEAQRRSQLIDELLSRREFASFWALKWADVMMGNRETISERGVHKLHRYLVRIFAEDRPYDEVAREILTSQGNTIHVPAANFYRIAPGPNEAAELMSQLFLGVRIQCARCHNHPYETITERDYYSLAAYFAGVQLKGQRFGLDDVMVRLVPPAETKLAGTGQVVMPAAFGEPAPELGPDQDRREALADWLTRPDNRYFARSIVNRVWYHLLGRGIVEPIDDFRDTNPPSNTELLDALAEQFVREGFRFKPVIRSILNSHTYQASAEPPANVSPYGADPDRYFTHADVRMLSAEQVLDAIASSTGVPERFPGYPLGMRAIELAEGGVQHNFLKAFSKPVRDVACECARETEPSLGQVLHLLNNPEILAKSTLPESRLSRWQQAGKQPGEIIELVYLATLSRRPTSGELRIASDYLSEVGDAAAGLRDLQQALINCNEFLLRH